MITRIKRLAAEHPEQVQIIAENGDGSICAHIPVSWVKIKPEMHLTQEQKNKRKDNLKLPHAFPKLGI